MSRLAHQHDEGCQGFTTGHPRRRFRVLGSSCPDTQQELRVQVQKMSSFEYMKRMRSKEGMGIVKVHRSLKL